MSSWQGSQIKYALGISTLFSFYGVVGYIVWMYGDKYGYDMTYRVTVIALILLTLPFTLIIGFVAARRQKKAEKKEAEAKAQEAEKQDDAQPQKVAAPTGTYDDLAKSAEETVQFLKSSNLGESGKEAVYSLPWYLVIGTPKSGKSSLVLGSQLNFQTLPSQRQSEQKFIRPTRSVDWRVTNDAVFLDTAGRYQTEGADQDEWSALLETIKKHRGNRPIDGLLLVVSAERVLHADEREVEENAKVLRARLDDARQRLKVKFPVYLIFTHADAIEGFRDSFSTSKQEGKTLVWGSTIPLEKTENAQALFDGEYEILQNSVMKRRLMRLSAPFPPVRQLRIFNFPLHFNAARRKLGTFVTTLFRPNPFSESPFLRGFYFTAVPVNRPKIDGNQTLTNLQQTVGQTFFTEKFFRDVLLRDKDLVRTFQEQQQKPPIWGWVLTALGTFLVLSLLGLAAVSLYFNKRLLDDAGAKGEAVLNIYKADANSKTSPLQKTPQKTREEIKALDDLREVMVTLDEYEREGAPWYMRFGLYSGDKIYLEKLLRIVYVNAVEQRFRKPVVIKLEQDLEKFVSAPLPANADEQDKIQEANFNLLTAYLMLSAEHKENRAESTTLINALEAYWRTESKLPEDLSEIGKKQLEFYANQVDREQFPPTTVNGELVEKVRQKLRNYPAVNRYYKRKVAEISKAIESESGAITAEKMLSPSGVNTSFIESTYSVPGAYTLEGNKLMAKAIEEAPQKLSEDDWVMNDKGGTATANDVETLKRLYYNHYADQWKAFVKGLNVRPYSRQNAEDALFIFSNANSPVEILLKEIARQTNLSAAPEPGWIDWLISFFRKAKPANTVGNTVVEQEFRPLFEFIGEEGKQNAPIGNYRRAVNSVAAKYSQLVSSNQIDTVTEELARGEVKNFSQLGKAEADIRGMTGGLNTTSSGQEIALFLQEPLENLQALLGVGEKEQLAKTWTDKLLPAAKNLEKGYPFEGGQTEADLKNLRAFLNPQTGELSEFFNKRLKNYFETVDGQLKAKESSDVKFSDEFVAYLNNAFRLRRALYGESGTTEKFEYDFRLNPVKDAIIEVIIDGQPIKTDETASAKLTFPASSGQTGVLMRFASTGGTTSTSGSALPTNTPTDTLSNSSANTAPTAVNSSRNLPQNTNRDSSGGEKTWQGTWGLFRFFDEGAPEKQTDGSYLLRHSFGGKTLTATVKPSGEDLFDKNIFRSVRAPEKFLK